MSTQTEQRPDRDAKAGSFAMTGFMAAIWIVGAVVALAVLFWTMIS
ncbi:MAG TPA: hypothetical protein VFL30_03110 [Rhodanobacteraceae bacterium]|nr:hypothetical protein [Rhodanobacteraceae bacterium]